MDNLVEDGVLDLDLVVLVVDQKGHHLSVLVDPTSSFCIASKKVTRLSR
jgi:hypothetical protein